MSDLRIDDQVRAAIWRLPARRREQVGQELLAHIADLRLDLYSQGHDADEVERLVRDRFGEPEQVVGALVRIHNGGLTWRVALTGMLAAIVISSLLWVVRSNWVSQPGTWYEFQRGILYAIFYGLWTVGGLALGQETERPRRDGVRALCVFLLPGLFLVPGPKHAIVPVALPWIFPFVPHTGGFGIVQESLAVVSVFVVGVFFFSGFFMGRRLRTISKRIFL